MKKFIPYLLSYYILSFAFNHSSLIEKVPNDSINNCLNIMVHIVRDNTITYLSIF